MQPNQAPNQHTQQPIVTGTSVVAIKFQDGVVIAADNLGESQPNIPIANRHDSNSSSFVRLTRPIHRRQASSVVC